MENRRLIIHVDFDATLDEDNEADIEYECKRALDKYGYIATCTVWTDIPEEELEVERELSIEAKECRACVHHSRFINEEPCIGCFDFPDKVNFKPVIKGEEESEDLEGGKTVTIIMEV